MAGDGVVRGDCLDAGRRCCGAVSGASHAGSGARHAGSGARYAGLEARLRAAVNRRKEPIAEVAWKYDKREYNQKAAEVYAFLAGCNSGSMVLPLFRVYPRPKNCRRWARLGHGTQR